MNERMRDRCGNGIIFCDASNETAKYFSVFCDAFSGITERVIHSCTKIIARGVPKCFPVKCILAMNSAYSFIASSRLKALRTKMRNGRSARTVPVGHLSLSSGWGGGLP
ncbi:unnamed protein product [Anisakis simplex]|uniref:Tnp_DDE_dom domain-containing protein n=1 Tax=Anisakis simplex TaxID=6269 RepID=A0A0M3J142_ANISI|nr:unnamed protein product [Anisakis simplex]